MDEAGSGVTKTRSALTPSFFSSISGKLLLLTIVFVMLAEILIFVPSVANMRLRWLQDRLSAAAAAGVIIDGMQDVELPQALQNDTLMATGTKAIVLRREGTSRMIAVQDLPMEVDGQYDMATVSPFGAIRDALDTLVFGGHRVFRVYGPVAETSMVIELVMEDAALRRAMLQFARTVFVLSLLISLITGGLIFLAINRIMIRPIRRLTDSIESFSQDPSDPVRILSPQKGHDELAVASWHLSAMQEQLQRTLKQQKNLADLGLAVSKINHDMRNILSSAQLMSDRLADVQDPAVKRFAPKLLRTIDRAVGYTNEVLSYGRASEAEPHRRFVQLSPLVDDVVDMLAIDPQGNIEVTVRVPNDLLVDADSEQLFRVVDNLCRNAVQALLADVGEHVARRLTITALRTGSVVSICVDDTGPGMPQKARENLFAAFRGGVRSGGTGLGLAIARELILAHGGTIALVEKASPGTLFRIELPDRPVPLNAFRNRSSH